MIFAHIYAKLQLIRQLYTCTLREKFQNLRNLKKLENLAGDTFCSKKSGTDTFGSKNIRFSVLKCSVYTFIELEQN
jgi:hypothetical protein